MENKHLQTGDRKVYEIIREELERQRNKSVSYTHLRAHETS